MWNWIKSWFKKKSIWTLEEEEAFAKNERVANGEDYLVVFKDLSEFTKNSEICISAFHRRIKELGL